MLRELLIAHCTNNTSNTNPFYKYIKDNQTMDLVAQERNLGAVIYKLQRSLPNFELIFRHTYSYYAEYFNSS